MSLIFSPLMLTSSRRTSLVFQMMQRRRNLKATMQLIRYRSLKSESFHLMPSLTVFVLLCFAGCDVERRSGWSQRLGKQIHPHHQTTLREQHRKTIMRERLVNHNHTHRLCYLLYFRLQRAVQWPCLHMLRDQSHSPQNVKGQLLFNRAKVTSGYIFVLWNK